MPDSDVSKVVVEELNQSIQLQCPASITSGTWDAHIFSLPIGTSLDVYNFPAATLVAGNIYTITNDGGSLVAGPTYTGPVGLPSGQTVAGLGMINVSMVPSGEKTLPSSSGGVFNTPSNWIKLAPPSNITGRRRCIAAAFEVHNTTAELYKQGTVTVYRIPQSKRPMMLYGPLTSSAPTSFGGPGAPLSTTTLSTVSVNTPLVAEYDVYDLPPANIEEAMLYPGSRQWNAADGCYNVLAMDIKQNNLSMPEYKPIALLDGERPILGYSGFTQPASWAEAWSAHGKPSDAIYQPFNVVAGTNPYFQNTIGFTPSLRIPFHTGGAFFTGLSLQTSLTVTLRTTWEVAPLDGDSSSALVPLAKPSPEYDPLAFELYQRAITHLPPGVPVHMNAAGDWWDWTLGVLAEVAPLVGSLVPGGSLVGSAAGKVIKAAQNARNQPKKKPDIAVFKPLTKTASAKDSKAKPNLQTNRRK